MNCTRGGCVQHLGSCVASVISPIILSTSVVTLLPKVCTVKITDDNMNKVYPTQIAAVGLDDSQLFTLKLKSAIFYTFR